MKAKISESEKPMLDLALIRIQLGTTTSLMEAVDSKLLLPNYEWLAKNIDGLSYQQILDKAEKSSAQVQTQ